MESVSRRPWVQISLKPFSPGPFVSLTVNTTFFDFPSYCFEEKPWNVLLLLWFCLDWKTWRRCVEGWNRTCQALQVCKIHLISKMKGNCLATVFMTVELFKRCTLFKVSESGVVTSWLACLSYSLSLECEPWRGSLGRVLGQDTWLSWCLSAPRYTNGYRRIWCYG